jgi:phosphonate degradation associated HDIG domain protein
MFESLEELEALYAQRGGLNYGEGVTQMEHALQCAAVAQEQGAPPSLIAAALLHDVGHLLVSEYDAIHDDDHHEATGARALSRLFSPAVCGPIALHVAAKRYLCFIDQTYHAALSPASQASLALQGGPFDAQAASAFEKRRMWQDAVWLRRIDDHGKRDEASRERFADYLSLLQGLAGATHSDTTDF